jgi:hypothetical protein
MFILPRKEVNGGRIQKGRCWEMLWFETMDFLKH